MIVHYGPANGNGHFVLLLNTLIYRQFMNCKFYSTLLEDVLILTVCSDRCLPRTDPMGMFSDRCCPNGWKINFQLGLWSIRICRSLTDVWSSTSCKKCVPWVRRCCNGRNCWNYNLFQTICLNNLPTNGITREQIGKFDTEQPAANEIFLVK